MRTSSSSSRSNGSIFSMTKEYLMFALTHAAIGAAAIDTRWMFAASNDADFYLINFATFLRISSLMRLAS